MGALIFSREDEGIGKVSGRKPLPALAPQGGLALLRPSAKRRAGSRIVMESLALGRRDARCPNNISAGMLLSTQSGRVIRSSLPMPAQHEVRRSGFDRTAASICKERENMI